MDGGITPGYTTTIEPPAEGRGAGRTEIE